MSEQSSEDSEGKSKKRMFAIGAFEGVGKGKPGVVEDFRKRHQRRPGFEADDRMLVEDDGRRVFRQAVRGGKKRK